MKTIAYPFTLDANGRIISTEDVNKIYLDRILTLLSTLAYQRPMASYYGTDIFRSLYEFGENYQSAVKGAILKSMSIYLPEIIVDKVLVSDPDESGTSNVEISFSFPNGSKDKVAIKSSLLNPDGTTIGDIV